MPGFAQHRAFAAGAIAHDRRRAAQRQSMGKPAIAARQLQHRLDLPRQLVVQQQRPAAAERPARFFAVNAQRLPSRIQRGEKIAGDGFASERARFSLRVQAQAGAVGRKQQIPAPLRRARGYGFQQQRIARRRQPMQCKQIGIGG